MNHIPRYAKTDIIGGPPLTKVSRMQGPPPNTARDIIWTKGTNTETHNTHIPWKIPPGNESGTSLSIGKDVTNEPSGRASTTNATTLIMHKSRILS